MAKPEMSWSFAAGCHPAGGRGVDFRMLPPGTARGSLPSRGVREGEAYAGALGADVDEIAKLCADLAAAGFIEPTTWH